MVEKLGLPAGKSVKQSRHGLNNSCADSTVYQLSDAWLMHDPYSENAKAFFCGKPHFDRLF